MQLPQQIRDIKSTFPWEGIRDELMVQLGSIDPALAAAYSSLTRPVFGVGSDYYYLPAAQARSWGVRESETLEGLNVLFALGHLHYALHDDLIDGAAMGPEAILLMEVAGALYVEGLQRMSPGGRAVLHYTSLTRTYAQAVLRDQASAREYLERRSYLRVGEKSAPVCAAFGLAGELCGRSAVSPGLEEGVLWMSGAIQLLDDLMDIEEDTNSPLMTLPKAMLAEAGRREADTWGNSSQIHFAVVSMARLHLEQAIAHLEKTDADVLVEMTHWLTWRIDRMSEKA